MHCNALNIKGSFLKCRYPQIIHVNEIFHYETSILGYLHFRKSPYNDMVADFQHITSYHTGCQLTSQFLRCFSFAVLRTRRGSTGSKYSEYSPEWPCELQRFLSTFLSHFNPAKNRHCGWWKHRLSFASTYTNVSMYIKRLNVYTMNI